MLRITAADFTICVVLLQPLLPERKKKKKREQELVIPIFFTVHVKKTNFSSSFTYKVRGLEVC